MNESHSHGVDPVDYWRLCDELSVVQAALLIVGIDPSGVEEDVLRFDSENRPRGFNAVFDALRTAINSKRLSASVINAPPRPDPREIFPELGDHRDGSESVKSATPNWHATTVMVDDIKRWLADRGIKSGFFFPRTSGAPDYLDASNARYAPKLAAAVKAWSAVGEPKGKTPKQALEKWLREHASEFGLTDDDGNPNNTGIEEAAKVANWQTGGGAPKTPTR